MKSMTKLIVVAMILVAALVVAPAAATRAGTYAETISSGDTVYVGEDGLEFASSFGGAGNGYNVTRLIYFSGDTAGQSIPVVKGDFTASVPSKFDVSKALVGTTTGIYYAFNDTVVDVKKENAVGTVDVRIPSVNLDIVLNKTTDLRKNSVNGKSVARDTSLIFELDTNLAVGFAGATGAPTMNIEVTLPGGGVTTTFQSADLTKIKINESTKFYYGNFSLTGAAAGTYTAVAKWPSSADFYGKGFDSKPVTFEVLSKALGITSTKDSVVRGNSFTVTISGESKEKYLVSVKPVGGVALADHPQMPSGQTAFTSGSPYNGTVMNITTNAGGTASVQFDTKTSTDAPRTYTIRVEKDGEKTKNDEVKVKVEEGGVTITTSGTGTYYIGEEITLSGTCTDNETVYLFMTGPNLGSDGVNLTALGPVRSDDGGSFTTEPVEADDTWTRKWNTVDLVTGGKSIDAGGYTIYAVSKPMSKADLSKAKYATAPITLRSGFITATTSGATVAKGDDLTISGTAQGNPPSVYVWIFGKNYYGSPTPGVLHAEPVTVESDGSFEHDFKNTDTLDAGQYFVVVQHPMGDDFGVSPNAAGEITGTYIQTVKLTSLQAPAAASALINALDSPNVRDTYVKLTFFVAEPNIFIDPIGTKAAGSKFTITGTTNLAVGDTLNVEVTSAAFQPGSKTEASGFSSSSGSAVVQKGDGANKWSYEVDATGFKPDQYIVKVEAIEAKTTATATFNVVAAEPTTQPAGNVTTQPAGNVTTTTTATTTTAATPTTTPGFGALVALAGLGAVAFLVLRRK